MTYKLSMTKHNQAYEDLLEISVIVDHYNRNRAAYQWNLMNSERYVELELLTGGMFLRFTDTDRMIIDYMDQIKPKPYRTHVDPFRGATIGILRDLFKKTGIPETMPVPQMQADELDDPSAMRQNVMLFWEFETKTEAMAFKLTYL